MINVAGLDAISANHSGELENIDPTIYRAGVVPFLKRNLDFQNGLALGIECSSQQFAPWQALLPSL